MHNAAKIDNAANQLIQLWAGKGPADAYEVLSRPDVEVTNQSDKQQQVRLLLHKLMSPLDLC